MEHFKSNFQKKHPEQDFTNYINNLAASGAGGAVGSALAGRTLNSACPDGKSTSQLELIILDAP